MQYYPRGLASHFRVEGEPPGRHRGAIPAATVAHTLAHDTDAAFTPAPTPTPARARADMLRRERSSAQERIYADT